MLARFWMILTVVMLLTTPVIGDEIKIASWNIQQFGKAKAFGENHEQNNTLGKIANIIKKGKYDLIVIQEVQDLPGLGKLDNFTCRFFIRAEFGEVVAAECEFQKECLVGNRCLEFPA